MKLSEKGEQLIKHFESCKLEAYQDVKGIWTIGWGNTSYEDGRRVKKGDRITQQRADELFKRVVQSFVNDVNYLLKGRSVLQHQFDSLVSFAYNVGSDIDADDLAEGLGDSTLLKYVLANPDDPRIPTEFLKWVNSGGVKRVPGLVRRRKSEAHYYTTGELKYTF